MLNMPLSAPAAYWLPSLQVVLQTELFQFLHGLADTGMPPWSLQACLVIDPATLALPAPALCTCPTCHPLALQARLADDLRRLTPDQFEWALSIVTVRYPGLPTGPGELLEFDISKLDSLTLRQLMDFVAACQAHAKVRGGSLLVWSLKLLYATCHPQGKVWIWPVCL